MKILFITSANGIDYLSDCVFHGLVSLYGDNVIDSRYQWYLSKIYNEQKLSLYGRGFTISGNLNDRSNIDRTNILEKIKDHYFNIIIYGSIWRCQDYLNDVLNNYKQNEIIVLDGEDHNCIYRDLNLKTIYFKRELLYNNGCLPISFAVPKEKIINDISNINKENFDSFVKPKERNTTYIYTNENDYYNDYQKSYFGDTKCKAGWDCLRHYEIIGNYCLPHFIDYQNKPSLIMTNWPSELQFEANNIYDNFNEEQYYNCLNNFFEYAKNNLTTINLAKYILKYIIG